MPLDPEPKDENKGIRNPVGSFVPKQDFSLHSRNPMFVGFFRTSWEEKHLYGRNCNSFGANLGVSRFQKIN
jgi:hypothetical protein